MRSRLITFLFFGIILVAIGEWDLRNRKMQPLKSLNDTWLEFCVGNSGSKIQPPAVTLVRINDDYEPLNIGDSKPAASADGSPPKLSRLDFATILGFVGKLNPKSVAFIPSPSFDEENVLNQTDIVPLKDAALKLPRMTLGAVVSGEGEGKNSLDLGVIKAKGDLSQLPAVTRAVHSPDPQLRANGDAAFTWIESFVPEVEDGYTAIRVPLVAVQGEKVIPSFIVRAVANQAGIPLEEVELDLEAKQPVLRLGAGREIPVGKDGTMELPDYGGIRYNMSSDVRGDDGKISEQLDYTAVTVDQLAYTGQKDDEVAKRILAELQGKFESLARNLVVVGFDRDIDRRILTVNGDLLSESSLLAKAIATIQSGRHIGWWPNWGRWLAVALIVGLAVFLFKQRRGRVALIGIISALIFFAACVLIFRSTLTWTPPFAKLSLFGLAIVVGLLLPSDAESSERKSDAVAAPEGDSETAADAEAAV